MSSANTTVYDIRLRYLMEDQASRGVRTLNDGLQSSARSANALTGHLRTLAGAAVGFFGLHAGKKAFVDFNNEMEQSKITIAGMLQMNLGGEWTDNLGRATDLFGKLQQDAKASVGTTKEFVDMASNIVQPLSAAGASMKDLQDMTKGMVVASKSMGFNDHIAAIEMTEALNGTLTLRNRFMNALLGPMGFRGEEGRHKWNALSDEKRLANVKAALTSESIKGMSGAQEHSFSGALSTLQDNLEIGLGKVGLPLFKAITAELNTWNDYLTKNNTTIEETVKPFSTALVDGFGYVRTVIGYIVDHKDLFLTIAKGWALTKGIGMVGGAGRDLYGALGFGQFGKGMGEMTGGINGAAKGFAGLLPKLTAAAEGLGIVAAAATALAAWVDKSQSRRLVEGAPVQGTLPRVLDLYSKALSDRELRTYGPEQLRQGVSAKLLHETFTQLKTSGLLTDTGAVNQAAMTAALKQNPQLTSRFNAVGYGTNEQMWADKEAFAASAAKRFARDLDEYLISEMRIRAAALPAMPDKKASKPEGPKITINHIDVASDDPDRFIFRLAEAARDAVHHPSAAKHKLETGL